MARIETRGTIQLTLPESSSVFVFPRAGKNRERQPSFAVSKEPGLFEQSLFDAIVQDRLDLGSDNMDANGHLARFEEQINKFARQGIPFDRIIADIDKAMKEIPLEGSTMGSSRPVLKEIKRTLIGLTEEILTNPGVNQP